MRRVPDWLIQVTGGLNEGRKWVARKLEGLSRPLRYTGWVVFQGILFRIQPHIWYALLDVVEFITEIVTLPIHVQLLLVVVALLVAQTALTENRFNRTWRIVENMDESPIDSTAVTDGGQQDGVGTGAYKRSSWRIYVVCSATIGGIIGVNLGPAGVIGFAVLGAMLGDDWARTTLEG